MFNLVLGKVVIKYYLSRQEWQLKRNHYSIHTQLVCNYTEKCLVSFSSVRDFIQIFDRFIFFIQVAKKQVINDDDDNVERYDDDGPRRSDSDDDARDKEDQPPKVV